MHDCGACADRFGMGPASSGVAAHSFMREPGRQMAELEKWIFLTSLSCCVSMQMMCTIATVFLDGEAGNLV